MNKCLSRSIVPFSLLILTGCQTLSHSATTPARIPVHSQESLVELRQTINRMMMGRDVLVAATAFNTSDRLRIQRRPITGPGGRIIDTGVDEKPIIFSLYLSAEACYLKRHDTGENLRLYRAECMPL